MATPDRFDDLESQHLTSADTDLALDAIRFGLSMVEASGGSPDNLGASFAPALILWPSKETISTTKELMVEGLPVQECVALLRARALAAEVDSYAIITDGRVRPADGPPIDVVAVELASPRGGYHLIQKHASGRTIGRPSLREIFESPTQTVPTSAELRLVDEAFARASEHREAARMPFALVDSDGQLREHHLDGERTFESRDDAFFELSLDVVDCHEESVYAMVFDHDRDEGTTCFVEVGNGRGPAFLFERDSVTDRLVLVKRVPGVWRRVLTMRSKLDNL